MSGWTMNFFLFMARAEVYQLNGLSQMHAYEPYLLGVYIGSRLLFTGENTYVPMTREAVVRGGGLDFVGTTVGLRLSALLCVPQRSEALPTNYYVYSPEDYCFRMGDAGDVIAPFHAYTYAPDNLDYGRWGISADVWGESGKPGDATAIDGLRVDGSLLDGEAVCDLQGRKVAKMKVVNGRLPKGIYITGGQKVIVK